MEGLTHSEVLNSLTRIPLSSQQDRVSACRCPHGELIEGQSFAPSVEDPLLCGPCETKGGDGKLRHVQQTNVIRHGPNLYDDTRREIWRLCGLGHDPRQGNRGSVGLGKEKAMEDDLCSCLVNG
jgi:hypothetical protein